LNELINKGLIQPSKNPCGWAPVLFVKKKDNTLRMCIDYRALNKHCKEFISTTKNWWPFSLQQHSWQWWMKT